MSSIKDLKAFLIYFNNSFPLDRQERERKGIYFNSPEHREIDQIDLYLTWLENQVYAEALEEAKENREKEENFKKGILLKEEVVDTEAEDALFEKLKKVDFGSIKFGD